MRWRKNKPMPGWTVHLPNQIEMRCANCHREINPANAFTAHDRRTYGPVCAMKLNLVAPKPKRINFFETYRGISKRNRALWQAQQDLFEEIA